MVGLGFGSSRPDLELVFDGLVATFEFEFELILEFEFEFELALALAFALVFLGET